MTHIEAAESPKLSQKLPKARYMLSSAFFLEKTACYISSGMVIVGLYDAHQERAVVLRILPSLKLGKRCFAKI
jgi:hypothetical protein